MIKRKLLIGVLAFLPLTSIAWDYCVDSKYTVVDKNDLRKNHDKIHFLLTEPAVLMQSPKKDLIEYEQRHLVKNGGEAIETALSLKPLEITQYKDTLEDCEDIGILCRPDEIIIPFEWQSPLEETKKVVGDIHPFDIHILGGPPFLDVLELIREQLYKKDKFEEESNLLLLKKVVGPVLLLQQDEKEKRLTQVKQHRPIFNAWSRFKNAKGFVQPHTYFHTHFPKPKAIVLKLGKSTPEKPEDDVYVTLEDIEIIIQSHVSFRWVPKSTQEFPMVQKWCMPPPGKEVEKVLAEVIKPALEIDYQPFIEESEDSASAEGDESDLFSKVFATPKPTPEPLKDSIFSVLQYPYVMPDESSWNKAWLLNLFGQIQMTDFLNSSEAHLFKENLLGDLWSEIKNITDESREAHWFTHLQTWINTAYQWIKNDAIHQQKMHKSADAMTPEGVSTTEEGHVVRLHNTLGGKLEEKKLTPYFSLSKTELNLNFPQLNLNDPGSTYLVGAPETVSWVRAGIFNQVLLSRHSDRPIVNKLQDIRFDIQDKTAWQAHNWVRPKKWHAFSVDVNLPLPWQIFHALIPLGQQRDQMNRPQGPPRFYMSVSQNAGKNEPLFIVKPPDWRVISQWLHTLSQIPSEHEGHIDIRLYIREVLKLFCKEDAQGSDSQTPKASFCQLSSHPFGLFYKGLAALDQLQVMRMDVTEGQEDVGIYFETLGVLKSNPDDLGPSEELPYSESWFAQQQVPFESLVLKMAHPNTFKDSKINLKNFFDGVVQPKPEFVQASVAQNFSFYDQPHHLIYTLLNQEGGQFSSGVSLVIQSKQDTEHKPLQVFLPPSCTTLGQQTVLPRVVKVTPFYRQIEVATVAPIPLYSELTTVACGSGELLFFIDGNQISCDPTGERKWFLHQALFEKRSHADLSSSPKTPEVDAYVASSFCVNPSNWGYFRVAEGVWRGFSSKRESNHFPIGYDAELEKMITQGIPHVRMIEANPEGDDFRVFLGLEDGEIFSITLRLNSISNTWKVHIPLAPKSYENSEKKHFRFNINPFPALGYQALKIGKPHDLVMSRALSQTMLLQLTKHLQVGADETGKVDGCQVSRRSIQEEVFSEFEKIVLDPTQRIYLLFLLNSTGSILSESHHALTKLVWVPNLTWEGAVNKEFKERSACLRLIKKTLGHGLRSELNLNQAHSLESTFHSDEIIPYIVVNGISDGALAFFNPDELLGISLKKTDALEWPIMRWAQNILQFLPAHYFFFGQSEATPPKVFDHQVQGTCIAFEEKPTGLLNHSMSQMDSCKTFVKPEVLAEHDEAIQNSGASYNYAHRFYHLYSTAEDDEVLLTSGPENLRPLMDGKGGESMGEDAVGFGVSQAELLEKYDAFYDPIDGQYNLVRFDQQVDADEIIPEQARKTDHDFQAQIELAFQAKDFEGALSQHAIQYLTKALKRYFCSFFTVYMGVDHLKIDPAAVTGDLPYYLDDEGTPIALHLFRGDSKFVVTKGAAKFPFRCDDIISKEGVVFSQPMHQLKVSAIDEWQTGYSPFWNDDIDLYHSKVRGALKKLERVSSLKDGITYPTGRVAVQLLRRLKSSLIAPKFVTELTEVRDLSNEISPSFDFKSRSKNIVKDLIKNTYKQRGVKNPLLKRLKTLMDADGFGAELAKLAKTWTQKNDSGNIKVQQLKEELMTLFLNQFLIQLTLYSEYFGPALRTLYSEIFESEIPDAQQALLRAVHMKEMPGNAKEAIAFKDNITEKAVEWMDFETPEGDTVSTKDVFDLLKICSIKFKMQDIAWEKPNRIPLLEWQEEDEVYAINPDYITWAPAQCGDGKQYVLSEDSQVFLNYFMIFNFNSVIEEKFNKSDVKPSNEMYEKSLLAYFKLFVQPLYVVGIEYEDSAKPQTQADLLPVTLFLMHQRPNLSAFNQAGELYRDDPWGEEGVQSGLLHPYYSLDYLVQRPNKTLKKYEYNFSDLNRWGLSLVSERDAEPLLSSPNLRGRMYESGPVAKTFAWPVGGELLKKIRSSILVAPYKMTEYSSVVVDEGTKEGCKSRSQLDYLAEKLSNAISNGDATVGMAANFVNKCEHHFGLDRDYPLGPYEMEKHFDFFNYNSLSPAKDHWVFLNYGFRSLPDLYFQALWDKWIHLVHGNGELIWMLKKANELDEKEKLLKDLYGPVHQDLHQFIYRNIKNNKSRLYDLEHIRELWSVFHKLGEAYRAPYEDAIKPYHDLLAFEVMFPMVGRYLMFPKYFKEFEEVKKDLCQDGPGKDPNLDFKKESLGCLEARTKRHLRSYVNDPHYFFTWDFSNRGFHDLFERGIENIEPNIDPFVVVHKTPSQTVGPVALNPKFWLKYEDYDRGAKVEAVPGYSGKNEVAQKVYDAYVSFIDERYLQKPGTQHLWMTLPEKPPKLSWEVLAEFFKTLLGKLIEQNSPKNFTWLEVNSRARRGFFKYNNETGGELYQVASAFNGTVLPKNQTKHQRYSQGLQLMNQSATYEQEPRHAVDPVYAGLLEYETSHGYNALPISNVSFKWTSKDTPQLDVTGCVGVTCFEYDFEHKAEGWRLTSDVTENTKTSERYAMLSLISKKITEFIDDQGVEDVAFQLHIADWLSKVEFQIVAVNVTGIVNKAQVGFISSMIFRFTRDDQNEWGLAEPQKLHYQKHIGSRIVGKLTVKHESGERFVCAPYLQNVPNENGQIIQVFVKRCTRFVDQDLMEDFIEWLTSR
jgi:hypothetical protein